MEKKTEHKLFNAVINNQLAMNNPDVFSFISYVLSRHHKNKLKVI